MIYYKFIGDPVANWKIEYAPEVGSQMKQDFAAGKLTSEDVTLLKLWANEVEEHGPDHIRENKVWDDHPLEKEWAGHRSSCFSYKGRIIYRVKKNRIIVHVVRITLTHDYRKGNK